jgi:Rps23 Pro-64 3,4-dihydroxylase Tpa1-like proline 4-hydroxylase
MSALLDFDRLDAIAREHREAFASAEPFPHVVIDDFLPPATAEVVLEDFSSQETGWNFYHHYNEKKMAITRLEHMAPRTQEVFDALQSREFVHFIERLTGMQDLISDPDLDGAGMHKTLPGGYLNVHTDFLSHTKNRHWSREINLLLYFNKGWKPEWNGNLELWDADLTRCVRSVEPIFNRCVIFHTAQRSFHGHPLPLACEPGTDRKSIALYYFRDRGRALDLSSTDYRALPGDAASRRWLIAADRTLLRAYSFLKRYTGLNDGWVSRILRRL